MFRSNGLMGVMALLVACSGEEPEAAVVDAIPADAEADADTDADTDIEPQVDVSCADEDAGSAVPLTLSGTTVGAGDDSTAFCSYYGGFPDVSYLFTAPAAGRYVITGQGTGFQPLLYAYEECGGYELSCNPYASELRVALDEGEPLIVVVDSEGGEGEFSLDIKAASPSEVDCLDNLDEDYDDLVDCLDPDCGSAANCVPVCPDGIFESESASGSTVGAPDESAGSCAGTSYPGADYSLAFTAPARGRYGFGIAVGTDFDAMIYVTDGCGGAELACTDLYEAGDAVAVELEAGQTVNVVVDSAVGAGTFGVEVFRPQPAQTCGLGIDDDLDGLLDCQDPDCDLDPSCFEDCANGVDDDGDYYYDCRDSWCEFDPLCFEDCANGVDDDEDFYPDCQDSACTFDPACVEDCTNRLDDDGDLDFDCSDAYCAADPGCASVCPEDRLEATASGSLLGLNDDQDGCIDAPGSPDTTFEFTAPADGTYTFDTAGSGFDTVLYVLDSCGGAELACNDDAIGLQSEVELELIAGQTVIVVVDSWVYELYYSNPLDYVLNVR